jgi:tRNA-specific adenosine deaminase 1
MEQCINKSTEIVASEEEMVFANEVAELCYSKYTKLPKTGKPIEGKEWTHVAGIVKVDDCKCSSDVPKDVVALGTGSKCIGKSKMSSTGDIVNDSHAEVMARRGFLRYLYDQVLVTYRTGSSEIFKCFSGGKCVIKDNVTFHFFTSHVPCGDAAIIPKVPLAESDVGLRLKCTGQSGLPNAKEAAAAATQDLNCNFSHVNMPSKMAVQTMEGEECDVKRKSCKSEERGCKYIKAELSPGRADMGSGDIYRTGAKCLPFQSLRDSHLPGANYHVVGALRAKPGRGEPTQSLSCSDKFAKWNVVGLQGALLSLLVNEPIYFHSVIVGGGSPFSKISLKRAIIDRLSYQNIGRKTTEDKQMDLDSSRSEGLCPPSRYGDLDSSRSEGLCLPSRYGVQCPLILQSTLLFKHAPSPDGTKQPCASSIVWCKVPER